MGQRLVFNGIDATTGAYLVPPMDVDDFGAGSAVADSDTDHLAELRWRVRQAHEATFAPAEGVDPKDLAAAGWAVVLPAGLDPAVRDALEPLLEHRRSQAGERFRILEFRPGDTKQSFLARNGAGPGPADPSRVPYYLLLVGSPTKIPFRVQHQLDVQYAIGRIDFDDPSDYAAYARSVVAAETSRSFRPLRATFFGTATPGDSATQRSAADLVAPLAQSFSELRSPHVVEPVIGALATKDRLGKLLADAPSLLFTATHGIGFPSDDAAQRGRQGAILCQDWPGPRGGELSPSWYFAAEDVDPAQDFTGMLVFAFACYGAGTPELDDYVYGDNTTSRRIAPEPFVAALPQRLLANPGGGALALVGHVDKAWSYSFSWPGVGRQTAVFESTLRRLVDGHPIGSALEFFNDRYAELSTDLSVELEDIRYGKVSDPLDLAAMWTANNDARAFVTLGDPAVVLARESTMPDLAPTAIQIDHLQPLDARATDQSTKVGMVAQLRTSMLQAAAGLSGVDVVTAEGDPASSPGFREVQARTTVSLNGAVETVLAPGTAEREGILSFHHLAVQAAVTARADLLKSLPILLEAVEPPTDSAEVNE